MSLKDALTLRTLFRHVRIRIAAGPNAGLLWSVATRSTFLRGAYESPRCELIAELIREGETVWDVGAHFGYVTLLAAQRCGSAGEVVAFEPSARNRWYLESHLRWNGVGNARVLPYALSKEDGESRFEARGSGTGHLGTRGEIVPTRSIDSLVASGECRAPSLVKADIEGAELDMLSGGERTLRNRDAVLLVATHSDELHRACTGLLVEYGYQVHEPARVAEARRVGWDRLPIEPELLAVGPGREVDGAILERFRAG